MEKLTLSVTYKDWDGRVAGDEQLNYSFREFFAELGYGAEDEFLVCIQAYRGEGHSDGSIELTGYFLPNTHNFEEAEKAIRSEKTLTVKRIEISIPLDKFFRMFKRFDLMMFRDGLDLSDRELRIIDY